MSWVCVGTIRDIPSSSGRLFLKEDGEEIGIFRLTDGRIFAVENRCPHRGGPLTEGIVSGHFVFCPLHDRKISLKEGKVEPPDSGCVKTFPVKIEGESIWVNC